MGLKDNLFAVNGDVMRNLRKEPFGTKKRTFEASPEEMFFVRKYRDEVTMKINEFCCQGFGVKPKISEDYISFQSSTKADDEVFRWTFSYSGSVFIVSLVKKELVYWKYNSIFKEKHHSMPLDLANPTDLIAEFVRSIALYRPNCDKLPE